MIQNSEDMNEKNDGMVKESPLSIESEMGQVQMTFDVPRSFDEQSFRLLMMVYAQSVLAQPVIKSLMDKLDAIRNLPVDWDVYGTPVPSAKTIDIAKSLIDRFPHSLLDKADIEPSEWGGVSIRVTCNGTTISIRILDSGITWYIKHGCKPEFHEEETFSQTVCQNIIDTISKVA